MTMSRGPKFDKDLTRGANRPIQPDCEFATRGSDANTFGSGMLRVERVRGSY